MLLLPEEALGDRQRAVARGDLAALYQSLSRELEPLLTRELFVPETKALLSRAGGRCERDGTTLDFDPWSPKEHRCPQCGTPYRGEVHDRAWVTFYHLWLAERAVHAALFHVLRGDSRHADLARRILDAYADLYLRVPNRDNVLGPTRLFFSTYLESIWLLNVCVATDLLAHAGQVETVGRVIERVVQPSSALIGGYDEGMSNRQVWNNAALIASSALIGDRDACERLVTGESGLNAHLARALLADGTWYEGENYHLFALRGLWYAVTMSETLGISLRSELIGRFRAAFVAPHLTALPDFTLPSRKDSQYAISLRQWRLAELAELGFARTPDSALGMALARCYESGVPSGDTGRARSTADVEQNRPPVALTRADLGWRSLLHALPELPSLPHGARQRSALLEGQGIAVFRRPGDVYVALDYGESGGGHGHPDRLNVTVAQGRTRWLDDLGTGSYVDPSLHWYRSTLAHNAPLVNGKSQPLRDGSLVAHDERDGIGWVAASFEVPEAEAMLRRTLVVTPDYLIDELQCDAKRAVRVELPWHLVAETDLSFAASHMEGAGGEEDGFDFVRSTREAAVKAEDSVTLRGRSNGDALTASLVASHATTLISASAPGQPASVMRPFYIVRCEAPAGLTVLRAVLAWSTAVMPRFEKDGVVVDYRGERHVHRRTASGWRVELTAGGARSSIDLGGIRPAQQRSPKPLHAPRAPIILRRTRARLAPWLSDMSPEQRGHVLTYELGEAHYRRSEEHWTAAGSPGAAVALAADPAQLIVYATVRAGAPRFAAATADNPYDNEHADTLGAGVQLYLRGPDGGGAWMLVPEPDETVRARPLSGWGEWSSPRAWWRANTDGYEMRVEIPLPSSASAAEYAVDLDVVINETTHERTRRRGQLVLSGANGEFVYLRGDRHDVERLLPLVLTT